MRKADHQTLCVVWSVELSISSCSCFTLICNWEYLQVVSRCSASLGCFFCGKLVVSACFGSFRLLFGCCRLFEDVSVVFVCLSFYGPPSVCVGCFGLFGFALGYSLIVYAISICFHLFWLHSCFRLCLLCEVVWGCADTRCFVRLFSFVLVRFSVFNCLKWRRIFESVVPPKFGWSCILMFSDRSSSFFVSSCRSVYHFYVVLFVVSFLILDCFFSSCSLFCVLVFWFVCIVLVRFKVGLSCFKLLMVAWNVFQVILKKQIVPMSLS